MASRRIEVGGTSWRVMPSGFLTASLGDELTLFFVAGEGDARRVRITRFAPRAVRARERALQMLSDADLHRLFRTSQETIRAPEGGYRA